MTVLDHPERTRAQARGDQAERLVGIALDLALLVRDEGPGAIASFLERLTAGDRYRLLTVLAAMVDVDRPPEELLAWVTFDETGRPLEGMTPVLPIFSGAEDETGDCGTYRGYRYHLRNGQRDRATLEACGCAQAARERWAAVKQARRDGTAGRKASEAAAELEARMGRYAVLRGDGLAIGAAAAELGVHHRTAARWERKLKDEGRAPWREAGRAA